VFFDHAQFGFLGGFRRTNSRTLDVQNSLVAGKMPGISPNQSIFAKIRLEDMCEFMDLQRNSLRRYADAQGIFLRAQGTNFE
jgi:hypothetical protein